MYFIKTLIQKDNTLKVSKIGHEKTIEIHK